MTQININDQVRFRLAPFGRQVIDQYHAQQAEEFGLRPDQIYDWFKYHPADADGYHTDMLYNLFAMLHGHMHVGAQQTIVDNTLEVNR